jgi:hypothetical protein
MLFKYLLSILTVIGLGMSSSIHAEDVSGKLASWLVPIPKKADIGHKVSLKPLFNVKGETAESYVKLLSSELKRRYGWKRGTGTNIKFSRFRSEHGNEAYELTIGKDSINIRIAGEAAGFRAVGRLLAIFDSGLTEIQKDKAVICSEMTIKDYPDIQHRGMHLQMAFDSGEFASVRQEKIRRSLDLMLRLGYNFAVFDIGGLFESKILGDYCGKRPWRKSQLTQLIKYAKARGITVYPGINTIGHVERAPQLYIKKENGKRIAMDVTDKNFYKDYFALLNELAEMFDKPQYILIGTDECTAALKFLAAKKNKSSADIYKDFLKKTAVYFAEKKITPVIWHDMLLNSKEVTPGEPANGELTASVRSSLPKNYVIDYWCYDPIKPVNYRGLRTLVKTGREIWVTPWNSQQGTRDLIENAVKLKIKTVLGSTWLGPENTRNGFVDTAEYAWNASCKVKPLYNSTAIFNCFYNQRHAALPEKTTLLNFTGLKPEFNAPYKIIKVAGLEFPLQSYSVGSPTVKFTDSVQEVRKASLNKANSIFVMVPGSAAAGIQLDGVNVSRKYRQAVLYTPRYGKTTRTNGIGLEFVFRKGKVVKFAHGSHVGGSQQIYPDGGVLSVHDFAGPKSISLRANFLEGAEVKFAVIKQLQASKTISLNANIPMKTKGIALMFDSCFLPIGSVERQAELILKYADGSQQKIELKGNFLQKIKTLPDYAFRIYKVVRDAVPAERLNPIVFEWRRLGGFKFPEKIILNIFPAGQKNGFSMLSAIEW